MRRCLWFSAILMMAVSAVPALCVRAGEKKIVLREHLNFRWTDELVSYAFEAPKGQCIPASLILAGPNGPVPVQLAGVELWPNTPSVKSARVTFVVDELAPLATNTYTVTFGMAPGPAAPHSDLKISMRQEEAEIVTSRFGARLLQGQQTYDAPSAADRVPGPIRSLRLADGTWFGGSRLYGSTPVKSWRSALTDTGPVFARVETVYTYANGNRLTVTTTLAARDYALQMEMNVKDDQPDDGWELLLSRGVNIAEGIKIAGSRRYVKELPLVLDPKSSEPACWLSPWPCEVWFPDGPGTLRLKLAGRPSELQVSIRDSGAWVAPQANPVWANFARWGEGLIGPMWAGWKGKQVPVHAADGGVLLRMNLLAGQRKWTVGERADGKQLIDCCQFKATGSYTPLPRLDQIKDMVLDWPDQPNLRHPYLYGNGSELQSMARWHGAVYQDGRDPAKLRQLLDNLGALDYMRNILDVAARYDQVVDSGQLSAEDRKLIKAQTALLAYLASDPFHWSLERGYCSGNPNMTVSRLASLGVLACALREHPMSKAWTQPMLDWTRYWLREVVDESGSWPESAHYARVSWAEFVVFAMAARRAGLEDFFVDPKFRQMAIFYEKTLLPPHPLRCTDNGFGRPGMPARVDAAYGRGTRNDAWGIGGLVAAATATSDPEFSRVMQWSWRECGFSLMSSHAIGGMNALLPNRLLPWQRPDWRSECFPNLGAVLRSNVGDPLENYLLLVTRYFRSPDGEIWPSDTGAIANWYAYGRPIGGSFPRAPDTASPLTVSRVSLATNWDPASGQRLDPSGYVTKTGDQTLVLLPQMEYVRARFPIPEVRSHILDVPRDVPAFPRRAKLGAAPFDWQRQLMQVTGDRPQDAQYLILRDTVTGGQPTQWQFWTLSEKIGTPREAADRQRFLEDKPGYATAPLRELKGSRFTALGQFGVDVEYFIATPTDTPRYTLRYGVRQSAYGVIGAAPHYQDLLYLELPSDGSYFVALLPRMQQDRAPEFSTLGQGRIIRIAGAFGTDYCFLSEKPAEAAAEGLAMSGTAGCVQDRGEGLRLNLAAPGSVRYRDYGLSAAIAASLSVGPYHMVLALAEGFPGGTVTVNAPGSWSTLNDASKQRALGKDRESFVIAMGPGTRVVNLVKMP